MLTIQVPAIELFDEVTNSFITSPALTLELEHSLVSLSKWEAEWEQPFLSAKEKTDAQAYSYIQHMCLTPNVPSDIFYKGRLSQENIQQINDYINSKQSATTINEMPNAKKSREVISAEIIYYWLVGMTIPIESVENWHLNRLFTLIKVTNEKNNPKKRVMPRRDAAEEQRRLNEERKAKFNTRG